MVNRTNGTRANDHRANGNRADVVAPFLIPNPLTAICQMNLVFATNCYLPNELSLCHKLKFYNSNIFATFNFLISDYLN